MASAVSAADIAPPDESTVPAAASAGAPAKPPPPTEQDLLSRRRDVQARLRELDVGAAKKPSSSNSNSDAASDDARVPPLLAPLPSGARPPIPPELRTRTDAHWDYMLKELAWLSADYRSERKRQISHAKRLSNAVLQHFGTLAARRGRELARGEANARRLAGRIGRGVLRGYWRKMERVVEYKQRIEAEGNRRREMDARLVFLVRQTERYGERLRRNDAAGAEVGGGGGGVGEGGGGARGGTTTTIEQALTANCIPRRRVAMKSVDYNRMDRDASYDEGEFYGEAVARDDGTASVSDVAREPDHGHGTRRRGRIRISLKKAGGGGAAGDAGGAKVATDAAAAAATTTGDVSAGSGGRIKISLAAVDDPYVPTEEEIEAEDRAERREYAALLESHELQPRAEVRNEVKKLLEERDVDLDVLLRRLMGDEFGVASSYVEEREKLEDGRGADGGDGEGGANKPLIEVIDEKPADLDETIDAGNAKDGREEEEGVAKRRRVCFASSHEEKTFEPSKGVGDVAGAASAAAAGGDDPEESSSPLDEDDGEDKDEFHLDEEEADDETTIAAEERLGRDVSYQEEIDALKRESEMSVEELRALYAPDADSASSDDDGGDDSPANEQGVEGPSEAVPSPLALLNENDEGEKDEFHLDREEVDDETTIAAEEKLGRDISYQDEIDLLKRESEMSIEELRAMYAAAEDGSDGADANEDEPLDPAGDESSNVSALSLLGENDDGEKDEFHLDREEVDDETTIAAEEKLGREMSYQDEIDLLQKESELSVEELRALYSNMDENSSGDSDAGDGEHSLDGDAMEVDAPSESSKRKHSEEEVDDDAASAKKVKIDADTTSDNKDDGISALESLAASDTKARETMLTRPFLLARWVKLRAYQQIGLNWLVSIQTRRLNGILADEMGLGKTLQTISMLAYLASYKGIWGPHLIIVPTSCLVNWEVEFKRFCPGLKVLCYYGSAKKRKELRYGWTKTNVHHVIITSYQLAVQDAFAFKRKKWYYLILDEAHNIKNFESQRWQTLIGFNTQRRLLLTGTPLQNSLMELWSLLHFLMPHVFTDRKQFSYWFSNPMDNIIEGNSKRNDDLINRLHGIIRPFVLRRLKKDVETQLPGKYEHIVKCQLSRRQMFLYEEFMARSSTQKAMKSGGNFMGMMSVLMQLRKVCNHPDLFEPRPVSTPFVMEPLSMSTAACVVTAVRQMSALEEMSPFLLMPLWTIGRGTPSFEESTRVDSVISEQLHRMKTPTSDFVQSVRDEDLVEPLPSADSVDDGLFKFLARIRAAEKQERLDRANFVCDTNARRCEATAFPYSCRMCKAVTVETDLVCNLPVRDDLTPSQIAQTPLELLALRKTQEDRSNELNDIAEKFVFCVPRASSRKIVLSSSNAGAVSSVLERTIMKTSAQAFESYFAMFMKAKSRLTMCFPDKRLVQFDAGKLQTLAKLLRELKQGGHRVLIFTQMSKMLDVLEAFLNLNGHTYLRLDGSVGVDRRQRLMDRFNSDQKVFCFILSTRSGGLGINLTGADTVVFYDSDWNPAMDAQAQDRAHRIGQTRDVHIYRMVTEHSIEENILTKAKQKRNLDFLVMDEGKFHSKSAGADDDDDTEDDDALTKSKLQNILGIRSLEGEEAAKSSEDGQVSKEQVESVMNALEDEDDVRAMQNAKQEAAEALQEFDESAPAQEVNPKDDSESMGKKPERAKEDNRRPSNASIDSSGSENQKIKQDDTSDEDKELEKEFAQWQRKVGMDAATIHESLKPLERYGLKIKEQIDPFYSMSWFVEQQRLAQNKSTNDEWDIEEIEQRKFEEEQKAFEDGDLLATFPEPESLPRQRQLYIREKARLRSEVMKRKLTGQNWMAKIEEHTGKTYWYNADTGEALWTKPQVLQMLEAEQIARVEGWSSLPSKPLVKIFEFLLPYPERNNCAETCSKWQNAVNDASFILHVWPVELGALVMNESKLTHNHFRTVADAMQAALPGDTIELGDGHYFISDPGLIVDKPVKFVGDDQDPSHVILELGGEILWKAKGGWMEGITIRRPRIATGVTPSNEILKIESGGRLDAFHCILDNHGSTGNCVSVYDGGGGEWESVFIRGNKGLFLAKGANLDLVDCVVEKVERNESPSVQGDVALPILSAPTIITSH